MCPILPAVDNAMLQPSDAGLGPTAIGTVATYSCDSGFYVEGTGFTTQIFTCVDSIPLPIWDPTATIPTCIQGKLSYNENQKVGLK